jgi:hypothetical protein
MKLFLISVLLYSFQYDFHFAEVSLGWLDAKRVS